jgi:hypothetical protein
MKYRLTRRGWVLVAVILLAAIYYVGGPLVIVGLAGMLGGILIGANMPERWQKTLIVAGKKQKRVEKYE